MKEGERNQFQKLHKAIEKKGLHKVANRIVKAGVRKRITPHEFELLCVCLSDEADSRGKRKLAREFRRYAVDGLSKNFS